MRPSSKSLFGFIRHFGTSMPQTLQVSRSYMNHTITLIWW